MREYLSVPYFDGDNGFGGMNCWFLVKHYLKKYYDKDVPGYGIAKDDYKAITREYRKQVKKYSEGFRNGAIACCFKGRLMVHVGVVVDGGILHTREGVGASWDSKTKFEKKRVVRYFYD